MHELQEKQIAAIMESVLTLSSVTENSDKMIVHLSNVIEVQEKRINDLERKTTDLDQRIHDLEDLTHYHPREIS